MSDLKWERWSWRESNSALQVLQVHLGRATPFLELFSSLSSVVFWFSGEQFSEIERGSKTEVKGGGSKRHKSKKLTGSSNIERCRFSCELVAAEAKGRDSLAMDVDFVPVENFDYAVWFLSCLVCRLIYFQMLGPIERIVCFVWA